MSNTQNESDLNFAFYTGVLEHAMNIKKHFLLCKLNYLVLISEEAFFPGFKIWKGALSPFGIFSRRHIFQEGHFFLCT